MSEKVECLVPKLRFPEYKNNQKWGLVPLSSVSDVRDGTHDSPKFYEVGKPLLTSKNLLKDGTLDTVNVSFISENDFEQINKRSKVDIGDILFGMIGTIGNPVMVKTDGFAIKNIALIKQKVDLLNSYLVQLLNSDYIAKEFSILNTGNSQKFIALGQIRSLKIPIPSLQEQQKIADCLSSLYDLITAQNQKVEALKQHKKGLMQQLFPVEGETVPKLRFPEFRNKLGWDEKQLKHACDMQAGKFVQASEIKSSYSDDLYPCYGGNGLRGYTKTYTHEGTYSLIGRQGALCGNINLVSGLFHATEHALVTTPKNGVDTNWLFYKLELLNLNQYATGQAQPGLSVENLERVEIKIPRDLEEQQEIAKCLSALDKLINVEISKADLLKTHKKSLMQQLFPMIEYGEK